MIDEFAWLDYGERMCINMGINDIFIVDMHHKRREALVKRYLKNVPYQFENRLILRDCRNHFTNTIKNIDILIVVKEFYGRTTSRDRTSIDRL